MKKSTPALPYMCRSPANDAFQPVNEKKGSGTGIGTLTPTMPASTSLANLRAAPPDRVKIAAPLPCGLALGTAMASSRLAASRQTSAGAKTSSSYAGMPGLTFERIVGAMKLPTS